MVKSKHLIVIGGPTASGKTTTAIQLARHFNTVILNADSRQFYIEMNIGTAKPTPDELAQAPHHFINTLHIENAYSVGDYERDVIKLLENLYQTHDVVILTGGSGLFIKAVCEGLDEFPDVPTEIREELTKAFEAKGIRFLQEELMRADPVFWENAERENPRRLLRALEICRASGKPFSAFQKGKKARRDFTPVYIQLSWPREKLYERINKRVDLMMAEGLEAEASALFPKRELNALQTVGYKELFDFFNGEKTRDEAVRMIKQNSRRYAKRQLTWFRKTGTWKSFEPQNFPGMLDYLNLVMSQNLQFGRVVENENAQKNKPQKSFVFYQHNKLVAKYNCYTKNEWLESSGQKNAQDNIQAAMMTFLKHECQLYEKK